MAKNLPLRFLLLSITVCIIGLQVNAQYNPATGGYGPLAHSTAHQTGGGAKSLAGGFECTDTTSFFLLNVDGITRYFIIGDTVMTVDTVIATNGIISVAYCNNLNGGAFSPTFYGTVGWDSCYYDEAGTWLKPSQATPVHLYDAAGYGNYLYFMGNNGGANNTIVRYTGTGFTQIFVADTPLLFTVAGFACDTNGNIWAFNGPTNLTATQITVISPAGVVAHQFAIDTLITNNAYGAFLWDNVLYVAFGPGNPIYPNALVPFTFGSGTAVMGSPIKMPNLVSPEDIASCSPGAPMFSYALGENTIAANTPGFSIYPNPAADNQPVTITVDEPLLNQTAAVTDITGRQVMTVKLNALNTTFGISGLSPGLYLVTITTPNGARLSKKLVVGG